RGPRYTITWTFPNGAGTADKVRQSVWPYAAGGPLTFMASGQRVLEATTKGGWFRSTDTLRQILISLGLPSRRPLTPIAPAAPPPGARGLAPRPRGAGPPPGRGRRRRPAPAPPCQPRRRHHPLAAV